MKKILMMLVMSVMVFQSIDAKPKVKLTLGLDLKFGRKADKDENGECPGRGLCTLKLDVGVEPVTYAINDKNQIALDQYGRLVIIIDKNTLRTDQPTKIPDFKNSTYPMNNSTDIIPSEVTKKLNINNGKPIYLKGDYPIEEDNDSYTIVLGRY